MHISPISFCFEEVNLVLSPNRNTRPQGENGNVELLVIHCISLPADEFGGSDIYDLFLNQLDTTAHESYSSLEGLTVSSHLFIDRAGEVTQFVPFSERAWHAGVSNFNGKTNCNDFSIGIELEGTDHVPYTAEQYISLIECTRSILEFYPDIQFDNIVGHSDIAPDRKTDPGPSFDWERYQFGIKDIFEDNILEEQVVGVVVKDFEIELNSFDISPVNDNNLSYEGLLYNISHIFPCVEITDLSHGVT